MTAVASGQRHRTATDFEVNRELLALADARAAYEQRLGWTITIDRRARRITLATGSGMSAITMPESLGGAVVHGLISSLQPAAVLTDGHGTWLTFLTQARPINATLPADLDRVRVRVLPAQTPIVLPIPGRISTTGPRWVVPPGRSAELPPWAVVVALTRRALLSRERARQP